MTKNADAFRTISEVAEALDLPQHVLRFWETRFPQIKPLKRAGGRRFYRPTDVRLLMAIKQLLYADGYTIKGVQRLLRERGARHLQGGPEQIADPAHEAAAGGAAEGPVESAAVEGSALGTAAIFPSPGDQADREALRYEATTDRQLAHRAMAIVAECRQILAAAHGAPH